MFPRDIWGHLGTVWVVTTRGRGQDAAKRSRTHRTAPTTKNDPAPWTERRESELPPTLGADGHSTPACPCDATADTPAGTRASPQTGRAARRQCLNFLVLCDTALDYTLSHSDKPDSVCNDYSLAITLTPPHPKLTLRLLHRAAAQDNRAVDGHVDSSPCSCAGHNLCNCAWQLHSQKPLDRGSSSQQPPTVLFWPITLFRSCEEEVEQSIRDHPRDREDSPDGGQNQDLKVALSFRPGFLLLRQVLNR